MDDPGTGIGCGLLVFLVVMCALFVFFEEPASPWPDTSNGAVVTVTQSEYRSNGDTFGGDTFVAVLDGASAAFAELFMILCGGGAAMWIALLVIVLLALAGLGAAG